MLVILLKSFPRLLWGAPLVKMKNWWQNQPSTMRSALLAVELTLLMAVLLWLAYTEWVLGGISGSANTLEISLLALMVFLALVMAWGYWKLHADHLRLSQTEKVLRENEQRYRALFHNRHAMMLILDPDTGAIVDANPKAASFYGYSHQQLAGMNISQIAGEPARTHD